MTLFRIPKRKVRSDKPRKKRLGFSLVEMGLVLIIIAFMVQTAIEVSTAFTKRQITQRTAANMSRIADDVQTYMERSYFNIRNQVATSPAGIIEADWAFLIANNLVSFDQIPVSPDGGNLRLFFYNFGDTLYSVIMSFDGSPSTYSPRPDPNVKFAGKVNGNEPNILSGWDFRLNLVNVQFFTGEDLTGNIGVMRYVSQTVNVDPYLHRVAIPGRPELNTMQATLDMGGFDINNANALQTRTMQVQDSLQVDGRLTVQDIQSSGDANITDMTATNASVRDLVSDSAEVRNTVTANSIVTTNLESNAITAETATFTQLTSQVFRGGSVFLGTGNYIELDARTINADQVIADDVFIGD